MFFEYRVQLLIDDLVKVQSLGGKNEITSQNLFLGKSVFTRSLRFIFMIFDWRGDVHGCVPRRDGESEAEQRQVLEYTQYVL